MKTFLLLVAIAAIGVSAFPARTPRDNEGEVIDEEGLYKLHWTTDGTKITFTIDAETNGYVGLGISPTGSMGGADIFVGGVYPNGTSYGADYFAFGHETPTLDAQQDWELVSASETPTHTSLTVSRLVATSEPYPPDMEIKEGFVNIIWAFGSTDDLEFHGFTNKGAFNVTLL